MTQLAGAAPLTRMLGVLRPRRPRMTAPLWIASSMLVVLVLLVAAVPFLPGYDPFRQDLLTRGMPAFADPAHPFGTDELGRDLLSRISLGARTSLMIAVPAVALSLVIGTTLGLAAGYFRGWVDTVVSFLIDVQLAIPIMLLLISLSFAFPPSVPLLIVALGSWSWMGYARVSRGIALQLRDRDFVWSPRTQGASHFWVLRRHILPNAAISLAILIPYDVSIIMLTEAGLSYIGLGIQAPTPSLGGMIQQGQQFIRQFPGITFWPGAVLFVLVAGLQFLSIAFTRRSSRGGNA
jgi:peptide/nickel transport system permease protein